MRGFIASLVSPARRQRCTSRPDNELESPAHGDTAGERRASFSGDAVDIRIDQRRHSPPQDGGRAGPSAEAVEVGHSGFGLWSQDGRVAIVGSGNFGVPSCSREDFMQIQSSVMDAFARAEAQFGDDDEFAGEIESEIDVLFDEFGQLKGLLVRAQQGHCDTDIERDISRLRGRIHDIVARINLRDTENCMRRGSEPGSSDSSDDEAGARGGFGKLSLS